MVIDAYLIFFVVAQSSFGTSSLWVVPPHGLFITLLADLVAGRFFMLLAGPVSGVAAFVVFARSGTPACSSHATAFFFVVGWTSASLKL